MSVFMDNCRCIRLAKSRMRESLTYGSVRGALSNGRVYLNYIKEKPNSVDTYIDGADGKKYQYISTRMETEYAWRTDGDENKLHHADGMTSVPEVLGTYSSSDNPDLYNRFLEFYVYNVYKEVELVDVPVDKTWPDLGEGYTWSATFVLQECEVHEEGPTSPDANTTVWRNVDDVNPLTIENGYSEAARSFTNLPKFRYYPNGAVYRIMYSVDETAYELKQNGTTVSKWDKTHGLTVGSDIYGPQFPHDAGDADDDMHLTEENELFYHIIVENHKTEENVEDTLTGVQLRKTWDEDVLANAGVAETDAYATFQLKRYKTQEFVEYDSAFSPYDQTATVKLYNKNGDELINQTVVKGAKIQFNFTFTQNQGSAFLMLNNSGKQDLAPSSAWDSNTSTSGSITVTGDLTYTPTIGQYYTPQWNGDISAAAIQYYSSTGTVVEEDAFFTNENHTYTLTRTDGWIQDIDNLPLTTMTAVQNGQQTITHYSYYFVEVDSNPSGVYAEMTDGSGNPIGDISHRITEDDTHVVTNNKEIPPFAVEKEWHDIEDPDNYPEIRFTLYQCVLNNGNLQEGEVFVDAAGESYVDIPLNSDNNWHWDCPSFLPTTNEQGQALGYYVVEKSTGLNANVYQNSTLNGDGAVAEYGAQIDTAGQNYGQIQPWDYYNDKNTNHGYTGTSGQLPVAWNGGVAGNEGTLTIVNRAPKYKQMDIKKKILEYQPDGSLATTTSWAEREHDLVIKIQLYRKIYLLNQTGANAVALNDWETYGVPFYVGYGSTVGQGIQKNDNDFDIVYRGSWHWTITDERQENGLPAYGYYEVDGQIVPVRYRYIPFEIGAYSNYDEDPVSEEYDWWVGLQPAAWDGDGAQYDTFPALVAQDQDRLVNIQATDLFVDKAWEESPDNITEVYVKIYRQPNGGGDIEDLTEDLAIRTNELSNYGFVDDPSRLTMLDNGLLVLGLTPETGGVMIHNVWLTPYQNGNLNTYYYEYWIEEVGYKDSDGNVYLNTSGSNSETSTFFAEYDQSDNQGNWLNNWETSPTTSKLKLSGKGNNKLRVKNHPTKDIDVTKVWKDENGNVLESPWDSNITSISFKVKRSDGQYLTFGGSDTLTISTDGQRAVVRITTQDSTVYTVTYVNDTNDEADIGNWKTIVHGLQWYASDGTAYTYTIEEAKDQNGRPLDSSGNVIQNCNTTTTGSEPHFTITNEKVSTSLAIKKVFTGGVELTNEQKQKITFTVTGRFDGTNETTKTFTYGVDSNGYTWNDGVLIINDISTGSYVVTEQNDGVESIFEGDTSGTVYSHSRTYTVSAGTVNGDTSASATVSEGDRTTVTVTNTYDEVLNGSLKISKIVKIGGANPTAADYSMVDGTYTFSIVGPTSAQEQDRVTKYVQITVTSTAFLKS